jgi:hypothetical protein
MSTERPKDVARHPPSGRTPITDVQRRAVEAVIGAGARSDVVRAVRDARGRTFQRLEFLGDPLLESVEAMLSVIEGHASSDHHATTDRSLATQVDRLGAADWLEWTPSDQRDADLVEAVAGAAYLTAGWPQVGEVYARLSGGLPQVVADLLANEAGSASVELVPGDIERPLATLGASMVETASTLVVFTSDEIADEGVLSTLRRDLHQTRTIAAWATTRGAAHRSGVDSMTSDVVETWLGRIALTDGPATAVACATRVVLDGRRAVLDAAD